MFEKIFIYPAEKYNPAEPIDISHLIECMLFYSEVHVMADKNEISQLLRVFGIDQILRLAEAGILKFIFPKSSITIGYSQEGPAGIVPVPLLTCRPGIDAGTVIEKELLGVLGKSGKSRRAARRFAPYFETLDLGPDTLKAATSLFENPDFMKKAAAYQLAHILGKDVDSSRVVFTCEKLGNGYLPHTNIDFNTVNKALGLADLDPVFRVNSSHFLLRVCNQESALFYASNREGELLTGPIASDLISLRFSDLIARRDQAQTTRDYFYATALEECRSLGEAYRVGMVSVEDVVRLVLAAGKFKHWLAGQKPDRDLVLEYYKKITVPSLWDQMPSRLTRFVTFQSLGLAASGVVGPLGVAVGVGLGVVDTFLLDKLMRGWRPDQFIEGRMKPLLAKER